MQVQRTCGHISSFSDRGMAAYEREERQKLMEQTKCPLCDPKLKARREKERTAFFAKQEKEAIKAEAEMYLDPLRGSPRQVSWARQIRVSMVLEAFEVAGLSEDEFTEKIGTPASKVTSARWWIDNRDTDLSGLADLLEGALSVSDVGSDGENPF